ncbi:trace amine-associated receptor 4-like [Tachysurus ichikawai]
MRAISNNFNNIQSVERKVKQDSVEVKQAVVTLQDKMARLEDKSRARAARQILHKGNLLHFYPDYSNQTATQRREMNLCRKKLTQIGISSFLIYPSIVKVTHHGSTALLQTPSEVEMYLAQQQDLATPTSVRNNTPAEALMEASP